MSVDIAMWRFDPGLVFDGQTTYEMLCDGIEVEGLQEIDIGAYLARIAVHYPEATRFKDSQITFDAGSWKFQIIWSKQHIHLSIYSVPPAADGDLFAEIANDLGLWMYHPTSSELFGPERDTSGISTQRGDTSASLEAALQLFKEKIYVNEKITSTGEFNVGDRVDHPAFGYGTVVGFVKMQTGKAAIVDFDKTGRKSLLLTVAPLKKLLSTKGPV